MYLGETWFQQHQDPIYGLGGLILAVIGIGLAVLFYFRPRSKHTLDYEVVASLALLAPRASAYSSSIAVMWGNEQLSDPHALTVRIRNTGMSAVRAGDYEKPIVIKVGSAQIYEVFISGASEPAPYTTDDVNTEGEEAGKGVIPMRPKLLNPGDWFEVTAIVDGEPKPMATARFAGQSREMRDLREYGFYRRRSMMMAVAILLLIVNVSANRIGGNFGEPYLSIGVLTVSCLFVAWAWIQILRDERNRRFLMFLWSRNR